MDGVSGGKKERLRGRREDGEKQTYLTTTDLQTPDEVPVVHEFGFAEG